MNPSTSGCGPYTERISFKIGSDELLVPKGHLEVDTAWVICSELRRFDVRIIYHHGLSVDQTPSTACPTEISYGFSILVFDSTASSNNTPDL